MDFSISNRAAVLHDHAASSNETMFYEAHSFVCDRTTKFAVMDKCTNCVVSDKQFVTATFAATDLIESQSVTPTFAAADLNERQSVTTTLATADFNDGWITEWHWDQLQVESRRLEKWTNRHMSDHSAFHQRQVEFVI